MINRILERLEALKGKDICFGMSCEECYKKFGIGVDCDEAKQKLMIDQCKEIVQEVAKDGGWIPCSERLPEERKEVLVWHSDQDMHCVAWYHPPTKAWYSNDFVTEDSKYIVAWCELPAPYQKGE